MATQYYMPTQVIHGAGCLTSHKALLMPLGRHALIVTGYHGAKVSGALKDLIAALKDNHQAFTVFDRAVPNPTIGSVYAGVSLMRASGADFLVAIGGGSSMDTAKAIALAESQNIPPSKLFDYNGVGYVAPLACIPTTVGTGSEVTQYCVLTCDEQKTKRSIANKALFPRVAFLDPEYTLTLRRETVIDTAVDALSHCIESLLSLQAGEISRCLALEGCSKIGPCLTALSKSSALPDHMLDTLLLASTMGGMAIAASGTSAVHAMGYPLTYFHGIPHGRANGILLAEYMSFCSMSNSKLIDKIITSGGFSGLDEFTAVLSGILPEIPKITLDEATVYAKQVFPTENVRRSVVPLTEEDLLEIYCDSLSL